MLSNLLKKMRTRRHTFLTAALIFVLSATSICSFGQERQEYLQVYAYHQGATEPYCTWFTSLFAALHGNTMLQNGDRFVIMEDLEETQNLSIDNTDSRIHDNYTFTFESEPGVMHSVKLKHTGGGDFRIGNTGHPEQGKGYNITFKNIEFIGNTVTDYSSWYAGTSNHSTHMFAVNYSTVNFENCKIHGNKLTGGYTNGAVLSSDNATVNVDSNTEIWDCYVINNGDDSNSGPKSYGHAGAFSMCRNSTLNFNGYIHDCYAQNGGGAIVANADNNYNVNLNIGATARIIDCGSTTDNTQGGAIRVADARDYCTISNGAQITGCKASNFGGAIYVANGATLTINGGTIDGCTAVNNGGAIVTDNGGKVVVNGGTIQNCSATKNNGGAIYNGSNSSVTIAGGTIDNCTANESGGAIFNQGTITVSSGIISNTSAGIFGNGIYQDGIMLLSGNPNFNGKDVYLPCNKSTDYGSGTNRVITKNGTISMTDGSLHVTLGSSASNLYTGRNILETGIGAVIKDDLKKFTFDNQSLIESQLLVVLYTASDATTHNAVIELSGHPTWVTAVTSQPSDFLHGDVPYIDSKEDLAWLISYVTGYNGQHANSLNGKEVILAADLDMDEHIWVPIGSGSHPFQGTFNGNGRIIKGLRNVGKTTEEADFDYPQYVVAGMFGMVTGTIKNTFVEDCNFEAKKNGGYYGIIADTITGSAIVHSSEVMGTLNATNASAHIGGIVGLAQSGTEVHSSMSFATLTGGTDRGGIVNNLSSGAKLSNSFCRFTLFVTNKEFCATSSGTVANCYYVNASTQKMNDGTAFTVPSTRPYQYDVTGCMAGSRRMIDKMNAWVASNGPTKYAQWAQPITTGVNYDCPVLKLKGFNSMASKSGSDILYIYYNADLDAQLRDNTMSTIFFYGIKEGSTQSYSGNGLYIDQDAALTGTGTVNAHTSRLLDNSGADYWHLYSSPLTAAPLGFSYTKDADYLPEDADPCGVHISGDNVLPSNTPTDKFDFYAFYEPQYHWVNFKRNSASHWHMDGEHGNIAYTNETTLTPCKGYLVALQDKSYLQSSGTLNKGTVSIAVTSDAGNELTGYNLIGNPYQSYLSFADFAEENTGLWSGTTPSFVVYDAATDTYVPGSAATPSSGSYASTGDINIHQGFFIVKTGSATTATFNESMRSVKPADGTHFRGERPAFPLVNLKAVGPDGTGDVAVVEFGRPQFEGAAKMKNIGSTGKVYFRYAGEDYAVLYLDETTDQLPLHFECSEDGDYTMTWSTANADFTLLHLIDNITGSDIDMLASDAYTFSASSSDYRSRFRMVFAYTGIDEDNGTENTESFAFTHDGNLVVNGEGLLEVIDLNGRVIGSTWLCNEQSVIPMPNAAQGIYLLKLTGNNNVRTQKIVVR